jgi:hypothetical protein
MKQSDAYKLLAAFMILIMIIVPVAYVVTSPRSETTQTPEQQSQQEKYNPEYWVVNQPFYSISDALNLTPYGVMTANYTDLESMTPQMVQWARQIKVDLIDYPIVGWMDSLYKSNTTKVYYGHLKNGKNESFLLLSTMFPEKNDFEYIVPLWAPYKGYYILQRQEQGISGMFNLMGNPAIFAPPQTAVDVVYIMTSLNKTTTAYDQYEGLLSKVEPAPYQMINSNVTFANQFYLGVRVANGSYERTTVYLNINSSTLKKLNQLKANSTQKDFAQYNITRSGNYTIVKIVSLELLKVVNEEVS